MKCQVYETSRGKTMEKGFPAPPELKAPHPQLSPVKEGHATKPHFPPAGVTTALFSLNDCNRAIHNKENSQRLDHDRTVDSGFEDSGYLSLHHSHADDSHVPDEEAIQGRVSTIPASPAASCRSRVATPKHSPIKFHGRMHPVHLDLGAVCTPAPCPERRTLRYSLSSTPAGHHDDPNLPILNFQRAVCEELAKGFRKTKRYDWSVVTRLADDHLLDRVIGRQMGLEYVDVFSSLMSRNMRSILTQILAHLGDLDLISCKKVSKTWRKIICEDTAAQHRSLQAEQALRESRSSQIPGMTRDAALSRVVLSSIQALATSTSSTSSSPCTAVTSACRVNKQTAASSKHGSKNSRFSEYVQAASLLKQHESLCSCKRCGSPATCSPAAQRAKCTRTSCDFDFCTRCQEAFHGSSECRVAGAHFHSSKADAILPGSSRSKRNIRRL